MQFSLPVTLHVAGKQSPIVNDIRVTPHIMRKYTWAQLNIAFKIILYQPLFIIWYTWEWHISVFYSIAQTFREKLTNYLLKTYSRH